MEGIWGSITVLLMDAGSAQAGQANFTVDDNANGTKKYTATFTAAANYAQVNLYVISECELYLANFTLIENEPSAESIEYTTTGTKVWHQLNTFGKGSQVETPADAKGQDGFADDYTLLVVATGGEMVAELFQGGPLVPAGHDFKSISLTFKYYIPEDFSGTGLYIKVDGAFQPIPAMPGYHTATYTSTTAADFVCIYASTGTAGNVYLGSVDYTVVTTADFVENTTTDTKVWHQLNNFGKGSQVETPAGAKGQDGFADDYTLLVVATGGEMVAELFQVGSLIPAGQEFKSITLTFKYYIPEDFSGTGLYIKVDGNFQAITATPGYHTATYTTTALPDFVCIYSSTGTAGNVYLGSVVYTLVTTA